MRTWKISATLKPDQSYSGWASSHEQTKTLRQRSIHTSSPRLQGWSETEGWTACGEPQRISQPRDSLWIRPGFSASAIGRKSNTGASLQDRIRQTPRKLQRCRILLLVCEWVVRYYFHSLQLISCLKKWMFATATSSVPTKSLPMRVDGTLLILHESGNPSLVRSCTFWFKFRISTTWNWGLSPFLLVSSRSEIFLPLTQQVHTRTMGG